MINIKKILYQIKKNYIEISSITISFCALFLTIYQAKTSDYHNRLSVIPIIKIDIDHEDINTLKVRLKNVGSGIAIVTDIESNQSRMHSFTDYISKKAISSKIDIQKYLMDSTHLQRFNVLHLLPGETQTLFTINFPNDDNEQEKFSEFIRSMIKEPLLVCYRSVYGDTFNAAMNPKSIYPDDSCIYDGYYKIFGEWRSIQWIWESKIPPNIAYPD